MQYRFEKSIRHNTIEISFDRWDPHPHSRDPFIALVEAYAVRNSLKIKTVDAYFNYKFKNDPLNVLFYWNALSIIYVYVPRERDIPTVRGQLGKIINEQNQMLREFNFPRYAPWQPPREQPWR